MPDDKSSFNLLLLNDGQDIEQLHVKEIIDSLYKKKLIQPLVVVAIHTSDRMKELGITGYPDFKNNGTDAAKYSALLMMNYIPLLKRKLLYANLNL